jgi:hypothetical protein
VKLASSSIFQRGRTRPMIRFAASLGGRATVPLQLLATADEVIE